MDLSNGHYLHPSRLTTEGKKTLEKINMFINMTISKRIGLMSKDYNELIKNLKDEIKEQVFNEFIYKNTVIFKIK